VRSLLLSMRVLSMLGIMIAAACGDSSEQSQMDGFIEYQGPSFVMQVPSNWAQSSNEQFTALFAAPPEQDFSANLGVAITPVIEGTTVEEVAASARRYQEQDYPNYAILEEATFELNGNPAFRRVYKWRSDEHNLAISQEQVFVKAGDRLYTLTATALTENYGSYAPTFSKMTNSFQASG